MSHPSLARRAARRLPLPAFALAGLAAAAPGCASSTGGSAVDAGHTDARPLADVGAIDTGPRDAARGDAGADAAADAATPGDGGNTCVPGAPCSTGDPCTISVTDCASGAPACTTTGPAPAGAACTDGSCDGAGHCVVCTPGASCTPAEACREGSTICEQGVATCVAGALSPPGTVCSGGTCDASGHCGCVAGSACDPSEECRTGTSACGPDGVVMCSATGNEPAGTTCAGGVCDGAGGCVPCVAGAACTPPSSCDSGHIECTSGAPVCAVTSHLPAGVACPTGVCDGSGTCNACTAGASCTTSNPCTTASIDCSTGASVCNVVGLVPAGTSCPDGVCSGAGTCVPCAAGASCSTGDPCTAGSLACSTGAAVCTVSGSAPAGTSCPGGVCNGSGVCNPCAAGTSCPTGNPCTTGAIACGSGAPTCVASGNVAPGTPCPGGVCSGSGTCNACSAGTSCSTGNACTTGTIQCSSGAPSCAFSANAAPGTPCPGGMCNGSGACLASCTGTPWGTVPSGTSNVAYASSSPAGACVAETRTCTNGTLSGSFTATSCTPGCTGTPWGDVPSGYSNTAYLSASPGGPCYGQTRTCSSGSLGGSYTATSCTPGPSPACRITLTAGGLGGGGPSGGPYSVSLGWGVSVANTYGLSACGVTVTPSESGLSAYTGPVYSFAAGASGGEGPFKNTSSSSLPYLVSISASAVVCPAGTSQVAGPTSASCSMTLQANGVQVDGCSSSVIIDCR